MPDDKKGEDRSVTRRTVLKSAVVLGTGLVVSFWLSPDLSVRAQSAVDDNERAATAWKPNAFIRISPDNHVVVTLHKAEMGQGIHTALLMLINEELEADWNTLQIETAPVHSDYNHTLWKVQGTGASTSISSTWQQMRLAGATVREMLIAAAADTWQVPTQQCFAETGAVVCKQNNQRLSYGKLAVKASRLPMPTDVVLKDPKAFTLVGKPQRRLGAADKVTAKAVYGIDVRLPQMLTAVVVRSPVFGGKVKSFDPANVKAMPGIHHVVPINNGIAIVADNFWQAHQGREQLAVIWDEGPNADLSSDNLRLQYREIGESEGLIARKEGNVQAAFGTSAHTLEAAYELPYLAHTPMEPLNCVADVRADSCTIWTGTQMQTTDQAAACAITGLAPEQVKIHTTLLGSSFGRRANPHADYVKEAVEVSKAIQAPVMTMWSREDDVRGGFYRPMHYSKIIAGLDEQGNITAWLHRIVGESIAVGTRFEAALVHNGVNHLSVEGASDHPYNIAHQQIEYCPTDNGVPVLWWRSVGHSCTAFVIETFIDEIAAVSHQDPVDFRLDLLIDKPRHKAVLELVAAKSGWKDAAPSGRYRGLALHPSFGSITAQVVEASVDSDSRKVSVERVVCAVDCGLVVNPDTVRDQIESGIVYGLTAALHGEITIEAGRVKQSNFHDYPALRMNEMPEIEVHLIDSLEKPSGVGEISTPPIAPALCNAIFAATGQRIRRLPIDLKPLIG